MGHSLKRRFRDALIGITLASVIGCGNVDKNLNHVYVPIGRVGYTENKTLVSEDFKYCNALILDSGDQALLAHALPGSTRLASPYNAQTVVNYLLEDLEKHGMNPDSVEAIVNAGSERDLELILGDLREKGIKVREASYDTSNGKYIRDVRYNPVTDDLSVTYDSQGG